MVEIADTVIKPTPLTEAEFDWLHRLLDNLLFKVLAYRLNDNWEPVAERLGFNYMDIQQIKALNSNIAANSAEKMLMNWFLRQANMEVAMWDLRNALEEAGRHDCIRCIDDFLRAPFDLSVNFERELQTRVIETTLNASLRDALGKDGLLQRNCDIVSPNVDWDTPIYKIMSRSVTLKRRFRRPSDDVRRLSSEHRRLSDEQRRRSMSSSVSSDSGCIYIFQQVENLFVQAYHSDLDPLVADPNQLDRTVLERMQRNEPNSLKRMGMFLMVMASRGTNNSAHYYLYVFTRTGNVIRCTVQQDASLRSFRLGSRGEPELPSVNELLKHFMSNPLRYKSRNGEERNVKLTNPIPKAPPA